MRPRARGGRKASQMAKFLICICASLHVLINLLNHLHVGKSSKGAENETWLCVKMTFNLDLNLDDGHDER